MSRFIYIIDVWNYANGAKESYFSNPYIIWISVNFQAASKPCKRPKNRDRTAMKGR